jgi:excisionase family DNA binding protein
MPTVKRAPRLYNPDEVAEILGCGRANVYRLIKSRELRSVKIGGLRRIPAEALDELIAAASDADES